MDLMTMNKHVPKNNILNWIEIAIYFIAHKS